MAEDSDTPEADPEQRPLPDETTRRLIELLGEVVQEAQQRLAWELLPTRKKTRRRSQPMPFLDLAAYEGMKDREVAGAICPEGDDLRAYVAAIRRERSGSDDSVLHHRKENRCEAGRPAMAGLRCIRAALPSERWCRGHHPQPPEAPNLAAENRLRVAAHRLWSRADGRVLQALYELTDWVQDLAISNQELLERMRRLDRMMEVRAPMAWMNAGEAAQYTGRRIATIQAAAAAGELSGVRAKLGSSWAFRPADLDAWMESGKASMGRYMHPLPHIVREKRRQSR